MVADFAEPNGAARWDAGRRRCETDPDLAREIAAAKADMRAALAVDGQNAKAEYEAQRRAVHANIARLTALRLARDAAVAVAPKKRVAAKKAQPSEGRGIKGVLTRRLA